ncbi:hypothetical protein QAD02_007247 [Eretmocerus hayati]|uniref:Uncharacterized protein n=1 Tax=Eretmocerus hayati TaxID=131215 RepID=A0ACC2N340_9HYME|nr:hypothetical protein QAD02_007247 [Eretmocerus hayati]
MLITHSVILIRCTHLQSIGCQTNNIMMTLLEAVKISDEVEVRSLLEQGVEPNQRGDLGEFPLLVAVIENSLAIVTMLLDRGADVRLTSDTHGGSATMVAARRGYISILRHLLANGASAQERYLGTSILDTTVDTCHAELEVKLSTLHALFQYGASVNDISTHAIYRMIEHMETDVLKLLVRKGLNMIQIRARHSPQNSPIHRALRNPDLGVLHTLLKIGAGSLEDRNHLGYTTIYQAVRQRNINAVRYLIHRGAEVNTESARSTPIDYALLHELQDEMKIILTRYMDPAIVKLKISQHHEEVTRPVIKAMLKRIATAPKLVDKEFFTFVTKYCYKFSVYFERCLSEVEILNSTPIGHESLYEVLTAKMCTMSWRWRCHRSVIFCAKSHLPG